MASTRLLMTGPHLSHLVSGVDWEFEQEIGSLKENLENFAMKYLKNWTLLENYSVKYVHTLKIYQTIAEINKNMLLYMFWSDHQELL